MNRILLSDVISRPIVDYWMHNVHEPISVCDYYNDMGWDLIKEDGHGIYSIPKHQHLFFLLKYAN